MVPFPNGVRQTCEERGGCFSAADLENHQRVCQLLAHAGPVLPVRLRDVTSQRCPAVTWRPAEGPACLSQPIVPGILPAMASMPQ
ncbi:hypothetical protein QYF61_013206 [Mycteria americana]|uniref:Uncharacterized protein n=1 Tax=Mycteria americana TaxID=33587 RepID=A0AAN7S0Q8_MYCAM|nr:hypothetical protein QYF61_013206 [Mycteria americana]